MLSQDYADIEYIIIDGASVDGTAELIGQYTGRVSRILSEKDKGIYDAMNKGLKMAAGDLIGILNSDDVYTDEHVISKVVSKISTEQTDSLYADLVYIDRRNNDRIVRVWKSKPYKKDAFVNGWMPPHPTFFVRKKVYERYGYFNTDMGTAADYELMLRFIHKHAVSISYLPETIIRMAVGGASNASFWQRLKANRNDLKAWQVNGLSPRFYTLLLKPLSKLMQFFRRA